MIIDTRDKGQERMMREKKEYDISERGIREAERRETVNKIVTMK